MMIKTMMATKRTMPLMMMLEKIMMMMMMFAMMIRRIFDYYRSITCMYPRLRHV